VLRKLIRHGVSQLGVKPVEKTALAGLFQNINLVIVKKQRMEKKKTRENTLKRVKRQSIMFNTRELNAINHYCSRFRVKNRSKFMREAIITEVLKRFDNNHPTLWDDPQLRLFNDIQ
jgi:hypothetical protein